MMAEYYPGNPPALGGGDVLWIVNYFKGNTQACVFRNPLATTPMPVPIGFGIDTVLWTSADVNGDCQISGGDVLRLVSYFKLKAAIVTCSDYPPTAIVPANFPACQTGYPTPARVNRNVIQTESSK